MREFGIRVRYGSAGLVLMALAGGVGRTQHTNPPNPFPSTAQTANGLPDPRETDVGRASIAEKQERLRDSERQKRLVADSDKLLELATQLHADVAKTDKHVLSLDVIRRAEEIERLAHGVKQRMKGEG